MLDSLVRVSRRVVQGQTWTKVQATAFPKETMQPKSHALTLVLFSSLHRLPLEAHHTAISHRRLPSVRLALSRDRFPFNNFTCYLTPFSRCFSSFPHGTCSLSVSCQYLALDGIYHPFELHSQATRLVDIRALRVKRIQTGLSPSVVLHSRRLEYTLPRTHMS
jgi:hypothetical protein